MVEAALELWWAELTDLGPAGVNNREIVSDYRFTFFIITSET